MVELSNGSKMLRELLLTKLMIIGYIYFTYRFYRLIKADQTYLIPLS